MAPFSLHRQKRKTLSPDPATSVVSITMAEDSRTVVVEECPSRIEVLEFAVGLPPSILKGWEEESKKMPTIGFDDKGIVGTITILKNAAMIWLGWGQLVPDSATSIAAQSSSSVGQCTC